MSRPDPASSSSKRLGPWSLRWQEAQDNAARSRAARYQALSDHLRRMSDLERGRFWREAGRSRRPEDRSSRSRPTYPPRPRGSSGRSTGGGSTGLFPCVSSPSGRSIPWAWPSLPPSRSRSRAGSTGRSWMKRSDRFLASPREGATRRRERADLRRPPRRAAGVLVGPLESSAGRRGSGRGLAIARGPRLPRRGTIRGPAAPAAIRSMSSG